jgi:Xaa-Pro aminopeptidase
MTSVSKNELQRRWRAVREAMRDRSLDFLIVQSSVAVFDGSVRWLTDISVDDGYTVTAIFPVDDEMITMSHGSMSVESSPPDAFGVKKRFLSPMLPTLANGHLHAETVVEELTPFKSCRIGLAGTNLMSAEFVKYVTRHLTAAEFEDATDIVDSLKAIKSDEERALIRRACELQDVVFDHVLQHVQVGVNSIEVQARAIGKSLELGANKTNILVIVAPKGVGVGSREPRVLEGGDQMLLLIETNGPGGYWGELGRILTLGEPSAALQGQFDVALELQQQAMRMLVPGANPGEMWNANNKLLRTRKSAEERRIYAHGMGYDMIERPAIDLFETMTVKAGMHIVVHPEATSADVRGWISDNYLVANSGLPDRLHHTPQKIYVV